MLQLCGALLRHLLGPRSSRREPSLPSRQQIPLRPKTISGMLLQSNLECTRKHLANLALSFKKGVCAIV